MTKVFVPILLIVAFISCKTNKTTTNTDTRTEEQTNEPKIVNGLIQDCPEELIVNTMPGTNPKSKNNRYYIYKGFRKEIKDFDSVWVKKNCKVKETFVQ